MKKNLLTREQAIKFYGEVIISHLDNLNATWSDDVCNDEKIIEMSASINLCIYNEGSLSPKINEELTVYYYQDKELITSVDDFKCKDFDTSNWKPAGYETTVYESLSTYSYND